LDLCLIFRRFLFNLLMRFFFHWKTTDTKWINRITEKQWFSFR
jgi:hypothetical protein